MRLSYYAKKIPDHLVVEKCLWVGQNRVDINHIDNDLSKPLDYKAAFKKMFDKLGIEYNKTVEPTASKSGIRRNCTIHLPKIKNEYGE